MRKTLDDADEAIRRTREEAANWWEGRRALAEEVPQIVAEAPASTRAEGSDFDFAGLVAKALVRQGRAAHGVIAGLQDDLARALEILARAGPLAYADPSAIRGFHAGGLPAVSLDWLRGETTLPRPWWARIAPRLAARATGHIIRERFGEAIKDAVKLYDRQVESWLKERTARLVELYEMQAGAFREQIRRLAMEPADAVAPDVESDLESDLRELRGIEADGRTASE